MSLTEQTHPTAPMATHPALTAGRVAVVTGAASGIGLATARRFAAMGLKVCLADMSQQVLDPAVAEVAAASPDGRNATMAMPTDVSKLDDINKLRDAVYDTFGEVGVLMNNAGTAPGGGPWDHIDRWRRVLEVNLWRANFCAAHAGTRNVLRDHQHRVEAGNHLSARRHRL